MEGRCAWARGELDTAYHDAEWGVPSREDRHLFEMLILEGAQAGLSWSTILKKRETYRAAYDGFDPQTVAGYDEAKRAALLADPGVVRNRLKVAASVVNAESFLRVQAEEGSFAGYVWGFVGGSPVQNRFGSIDEVPASSPVSDVLSKDLERRGFKFVGTTIVYAFMQGVGMVNDHTLGCPRHAACSRLGRAFRPS